MKSITAHQVIFFSGLDEANFFRWCNEIASVSDVIGSGQDIIIQIQEAVDDDDLREILAICIRYKLELSQLSQFLTDDNKHWFSNEKMFWYKKVFK